MGWWWCQVLEIVLSRLLKVYLVDGALLGERFSPSKFIKERNKLQLRQISPSCTCAFEGSTMCHARVSHFGWENNPGGIGTFSGGGAAHSVGMAHPWGG